MGRKIFCSVLLCALVLRLLPLQASADTVPYFTFSLNQKEVCENSEIKLQINANEMPDPAAGFRMIVTYDEAVLSFVRTETSSQIKTGTMETNGDGNPIYSVYVCNTDKSAAPSLSGNIISFVFKVKSGAAAGQYRFHARIDQICNYQEQQLNLTDDEDLPFSVTETGQASGTAYLKSLVPVTGRLSPSFSPDVFVYRMEVPENVSSVEFMAESGEGGSVSINRRTLGKAGSQTSIIATVTSADRQSVVQYIVLVHRAETVAGSSQPASSGSILLSKLAPLTGELSPSFSPKIFSYSMEVPANVSSVEFLTEAPDNAKVTVSRHALGRAGSQTSIIITVASADKTAETDYVVLVHRAADTSSSSPQKTAVKKQTSYTKSPAVKSGSGGSVSAVTAAGAVGEVSSEVSTAGISNAAQAAQQAPRNMIIIGNQMPQYLLVMLLCTNCILIGLLLSFWLKRKKEP